LMHARFNGRSVPPHIHDEYSISITLRGGLAFDYRGTKHSAPAGVISCVAPGETHSASPASGDRWAFLNFLVPNAVVREVLSSLERPDVLPDLPRRVVVDAEMVRRLVALYRLLKGSGDLLERQSACTFVLAEFFKNHSTARGSSDSIGQEHPAVERARELLQECFGEQISLARLADYAGLSPYHLLRTFRAAVGMTPHLYLNQIRVLQAKHRLSAGAATAETAVACGFCDQSHMTRQFKRVALTTPGQYRNAVRPTRTQAPVR